MKTHFASVHEEKKPINCDICDYSCSQKRILNKHVAPVHEEKKPYNCDICDYSYSQKGHMSKHVASVHEGKSYSNVTFVTTDILQRVT